MTEHDSLDELDMNSISFFRDKKKQETPVVKTNKMTVTRDNLLNFINQKMTILEKDIKYYDNLVLSYRTMAKDNKKQSEGKTTEELLIMYQNELELLKEVITENVFLVPLIKKTKDLIDSMLNKSGIVMNIDSTRNRLSEDIKIYTNQTYLLSQVSIISREISKLKFDKKDLKDLTNIDFVNNL